MPDDPIIYGRNVARGIPDFAAEIKIACIGYFIHFYNSQNAIAFNSEAQKHLVEITPEGFYLRPILKLEPMQADFSKGDFFKRAN